MAPPPALEKATVFVNGKIEDACEAVGAVVVKRPRTVIAEQFLVTALCCCGFAPRRADEALTHSADA